jgi:RNA polymerase sigma factor (sigma-70 family)
VSATRGRRTGEAGHDVAQFFCSLDGVFVSAVRQHNPPECEATRQPHIPVRCLVEVVRADATKGAGDTMTTRSGPDAADSGRGRPDPSLDAIMSERRQLINLTYRLLGSLAEAEDAVQETYARWYAMSPQQQEAIESPGAWLTTVASRICLNLLGSARARRETYVGEWIPEPLPEPAEWISGRSGGITADPADRVTLDESVSMAFLVVLESMTPAERVAFILHDVFRYSFAEVAEIVGRTPAACRQLASSARRRIRASQAPASPTAQQASIVRDFKAAWEAKDIDALIGLLDPDATAIADGGGLATTFLRPIEGGEQIARAWVEIANRAPSNMTFLERTVNGQPGLVAQQDGVTVTVFAFDVADDRITRIWAVRNPDKLRPWTTG